MDNFVEPKSDNFEEILSDVLRRCNTCFKHIGANDPYIVAYKDGYPTYFCREHIDDAKWYLDNFLEVTDCRDAKVVDPKPYRKRLIKHTNKNYSFLNEVWEVHFQDHESLCFDTQEDVERYINGEESKAHGFMEYERTPSEVDYIQYFDIAEGGMALDGSILHW